jgi:hypothetical protein
MNRLLAAATVLLMFSACSKEGGNDEGRGGGGGAAGAVTAGRGGGVAGGSVSTGRGGDGGVGGAVITGVAGAAGTGGAPGTCPLPSAGGGSSGGVADCLCTYTAQRERGGCFAWGEGTILVGTCGSNTAWECATGFYVKTCLYDPSGNLIGREYCDDTSNPCVTAGVQKDPQVMCDLEDTTRPATGCATSSADGGVECCGDGHLSPAGPPFNCAPESGVERASSYCRQSGACVDGIIALSSVYGLSTYRTCYYDAAGALIYATRTDPRGPSLYCGKSGISSAWLGSGDASRVSSCSIAQGCALPADAGTD